MMVLIPPTAPAGTGGRGIRVAALGGAPLAEVTLAEAAMGLRTRFWGPGPLTKTGCPVGLPTGLTVICWGGATVAG